MDEAYIKEIQSETASKFFYGLSNPARLEIVLALLDEEKNVSQLVEDLNMKQSQISNQLICLKTCGFVTSRKEGKFVYYKVTDPRIRDIIQLGQSVVVENAGRINSCTRL
ncbi:helix-turn-helix transcriptional regulator [Sporosarcina sp. P33]|uniref:ArsR/SmtB family transcription factor n=1 Tax=Sporosarcina sp. P33 TaxID=1930764 RepID=UPI0009BC8D34|nr:metalloregulator ArsR/SmtB family transcription factor [Sporosarcina sp. P33]ARD48367.1 transcriptional regulator [Sporosarcina sp. P33]